jgi:hypothetical protein
MGAWRSLRCRTKKQEHPPTKGSLLYLPCGEEQIKIISLAWRSKDRLGKSGSLSLTLLATLAQKPEAAKRTLHL